MKSNHLVEQIKGKKKVAANTSGYGCHDRWNTLHSRTWMPLNQGFLCKQGFRVVYSFKARWTWNYTTKGFTKP